MDQINREVQEELELSPQRLKEKYESRSQTQSMSMSRSYGRLKSKSPHKRGLEHTTLLMDQEARQAINDYKNQIEFLKVMIMALDLKLKDYDNMKNNNELLKV